MLEINFRQGVFVLLWSYYQIKHSFNQSLISLHIGQWNLATCRHSQFEWLAFDTDQRFTKVKDTMAKSIAKFNGQ